MKSKLKQIGIKDASFRLVTVQSLVDDQVIAQPKDGNHGEIHPKGDDFIESGVPFIMASDVRNGFVDYEQCKFIAEKQADGLRKGFAKNGDVLLTHKATIGETAIVSYDLHPYIMLTPQVTYYRVLRQDILNRDYLRYYFESSLFQKTLKLWAGSGATRAYLGITAQRKLPIILPKETTQRKIAGILSPIDQLIENKRQRIVPLETTAEQVYREWFVRKRFPGFRESSFKKGIPAGWTSTTLGKIADFTMGQSPSSEFYNESGDGLPFNQGVGTYGVRCPQRRTYCSVDGRRAHEGDILFSVRAPVGRLNIADCDMIVGRGLAAMRHKQGLNGYLFYLLKVAFSNEDIIGNGAIFNSVGKDELSNFKVFAPKIQLVEQFDRLAKPIDAEIVSLLKSIEQLKRMKSLLLDRLMSGEIPVDEFSIQFQENFIRELKEELALA